MKEKNVKWIIVLLMLVLVAIVADIVIRSNWSPQSNSQQLVIPVEFMYKYPDCANKLVEVANLTNIHMVPPGTLEQKRLMQSSLYNRNLSEK